MTHDNCIALYPYFKVHSGKLEEFKALCNRFVATTETEPGCLYYAFTFDGDHVHCREGYVDGEALLAHLQNVGALLEEALKISEIYRLEAHGPEAEMAKVRETLDPFHPQYFALGHGFRR
jgi:quinol monooxygenase YgiN